MSNFIILKHCLFSGLNKPIFSVFSLGPTPISTSDRQQNLLLPSSKHYFRCKCIPLPSDYWKQILTTLRPQSSRHLVVQTTCFLLKRETRMLKMHESAEHGYNFAVMFWDLICLAPFSTLPFLSPLSAGQRNPCFIETIHTAEPEPSPHGTARTQHPSPASRWHGDIFVM